MTLTINFLSYKPDGSAFELAVEFKHEYYTKRNELRSTDKYVIDVQPKGKHLSTKSML